MGFGTVLTVWCSLFFIDYKWSKPFLVWFLSIPAILLGVLDILGLLVSCDNTTAFIWYSRFTPPMKLSRFNWNIFEGDVKHQWPKIINKTRNGDLLKINVQRICIISDCVRSIYHKKKNKAKIACCGNNSKLKYQNRRKWHSLFWLVTGTSIKNGIAKLVLLVHNVVLVMQVLSKY